LDDQQIQELFQQLIQKLILYTSTNLKQISTKLTVAVCCWVIDFIHQKQKLHLVRSFDFKYDSW